MIELILGVSIGLWGLATLGRARGWRFRLRPSDARQLEPVSMSKLDAPRDLMVGLLLIMFGVMLSVAGFASMLS